MENVLHTDSSYADVDIGVYNFLDVIREVNLLQQSLKYLEQEEKRLYQWVQETTYEGFIKKLREIFNESQEDREVLEKFKKSNLNDILGVAVGGGLANKQMVTITCEPLEDVYLNKLFEGFNISNETIKISSNIDKKLQLTFEYNVVNIKNALNAIDKRRGRTKFKTESESLTNVNKTLEKLVRNGKIGKIEINGANKVVDITEEFLPEKSNIFSYTKETIQEALHDPAKREELKIAKNLVYSFLFNIISDGSEDLQKSFKIVWNNKIGNGLESFSFFAKGKNISSGIGGALQEFALAIITEYIALKTRRNYGGPIAEILGDIAGGKGEQPKTDVQILNRLGLQVKAYNQESLIDSKGHARMMSTNIHPSGLDRGLMGFDTNIGDAIVQSCFNSSNGYSMDFFANLIQQEALAQAMSFTTNKKSIDTVCFYFLDAEYLIPGSRILKQLQIEIPSVSIRSPNSIGDDSYFELKNYTSHYTKKNGERKDYLVKNFIEYWCGYPLDASKENIKYYENLYNKRISIDVKFRYEFMYDINYSIFKK